MDGSTFICPAGKFGARPGLASAECSGSCKMGHYCPAGCRSFIFSLFVIYHSRSFFGGRFSVEGGRDGTGGRSIDRCCCCECCGSLFVSFPCCVRGFTSDAAAVVIAACCCWLCYCCCCCCCCRHECTGSTSATERPCPIGTFGEQEGLTNASCSGLCKTNNYCARGTINQFAVPV